MTFDDLDGSFKSLSDTLQNRLSPYFSARVSEQWLGALGHASAIARDTAAWNALPADLSDADAVTEQLDRAARLLASAAAGTDDAILAALNQVEAALGALDAYLARPTRGSAENI